MLAPLALVVVLIGVVIVVQASRPDSNGSGTSATVETNARRAARRPPRRRSYVVKAGDSLSVISERTGVPVERIAQLNPDLDAQTLRVGQRLRLTP